MLGFSVSFVWSTVSGRRFLPPGDGLALTKLQPSGAWFVQIYAPQPGTGGWEGGGPEGIKDISCTTERGRATADARHKKHEPISLPELTSFPFLTRSISRPKSFQTLQTRRGGRNGRDRPEVN